MKFKKLDCPICGIHMTHQRREFPNYGWKCKLCKSTFFIDLNLPEKKWKYVKDLLIDKTGE